MGLLQRMVVEGTTAGELEDYMGSSNGFAEEWSATTPGLTRNLRSLGVRRADVDDVLQATAERALSKGIVPDGTDHFRAWCYKVATRIAIDEWRKTKPVLVAVPPETESAENVVNAVAARQALAQFKLEVVRLPEAERNAIISIANATDDAVGRGKVAVARHRARRKLDHIMEGLAAVVGGFGSAVKRIMRARGGVAPATAMAGVATLVIIATQLPGHAPKAPISIPDSIARAAYAPTESALLALVPTSSRPGGSSNSASGDVAPPQNPSPSPKSLPLPPPPAIGLLPNGDGRPTIEGRPGTAEEEGVAVCGGTLLTPHECYRYPALPPVPA